MSLQTWKEEFYPIPAAEVPEDEAIAHSLHKWIGLRPDNLAKHDLTLDGPWLEGKDDEFELSSASCALCEHYLEPDYESDDAHYARPCVKCPLALARGGKPCDVRMRDEECSPWSSMVKFSDPEPMIMWLAKAKEDAK